MYAQGQQLSGLFDEGGWLDTAISKVGTVAKDVQTAVNAAKQVQSGNARVAVVPTTQGVYGAVRANPYTPWLIAGGIGLAAFLLLQRRR